MGSSGMCIMTWFGVLIAKQPWVSASNDQGQVLCGQQHLHLHGQNALS